jgi:hypothetical protein
MTNKGRVVNFDTKLHVEFYQGGANEEASEH